MAQLPRLDVEFYQQELESNECVCGRDKKPGHAFCYKCWSQIEDKKLQQKLSCVQRNPVLFAAVYEECYMELREAGAFE